MYMLEMRSVAKVFRTEQVETHALRSLDLQIASGEQVAGSASSRHVPSTRRENSGPCGVKRWRVMPAFWVILSLRASG